MRYMQNVKRFFALFSEKGGFYLSTQEIIDNLCKSRGYRKSKIEDELKLGSGYLSRVKNPSFEKLQLIADYFGVTLDYLMTGKESNIGSFSEQADFLIKIRNDKELMIALKKYYSLSDRKKKHILDLIDLLAEASE